MTKAKIFKIAERGIKFPAILVASLSLLTGCQWNDGATENSESDALPLHTLAWIDRQGNVEAIDIPPRNYIYAQLSPNGQQVALNSRDDSSDIWLFDLNSKALRRLTLDQNSNIGPLWAPDGRLAFTKIINGNQEVVIQNLDHQTPSRTLSVLSDNAKYPTSFTTDGQTLIYHTSSFGYDMWSLTLNQENQVSRPLSAHPDYRETNGVLSPNERWIAYETDESGQLEIYVSPFPAVDSERIQISKNGGSRPRWSLDGKEIYYIKQYEPELTGALMSVSFNENTKTLIGEPALLFENNFVAPNAGHQVYDVSKDGERFLMIQKIRSDF